MAGEGLKRWQRHAAEEQQSSYELFGDRRWDVIPQNDTVTLNTKISNTLFDTAHDKCSSDQKKAINAIREKVLTLSGSGEVHFGCVFVNVFPTGTREAYKIPLVRTKQTYGDDVYFVEKQTGRVYTGWTDYLKKNQLPSGYMCYPADGFYQSDSNGRVKIAFKEIAGKSKVGAVLDQASAVANTTSAGIFVASLFLPVATPVVLGASTVLGVTTVYSTARKVKENLDKKKHHVPVSANVWINIGADVISAVLAGGAVVLKQLVASGRLSASMARSIMEIVRWVSVGVNSCGVVTSLIICIGKYKSGNLDATDIGNLISYGIFIGNFVMSIVVAEKVIHYLSDRPSQLVNIFKMSSNTVYSVFKTMTYAVTMEVIIEMICGRTVVAFMRHCGMEHLSQLLQGAAGLFRQFRRGVFNVWSLLFELYSLLNGHLMEVLDEVGVVWKSARTFFISLNLPNLFRTPSIEAAEIVNNGERLLDDANICDERNRQSLRDEVIGAALQMAKDMNAETEHAFSIIGQRAMNDIRRRCSSRLVVAAGQGKHLLQPDYKEILREAIREFKEEFKTNETEEETDAAIAQSSDLPLIPLSMSNNIDMYVFQVPYEVAKFDQFVDDAARHFLQDDTFLNNRVRTKSDQQPIIMIQNLGKSLIFLYQRLQNSDKTVGLVLLK